MRKTDYYGEEGMVKNVAKAGENWIFALEENETDDFVGKFGFTMKNKCGSQELEQRYFKNSKGEIVSKINGIHEIVTAAKT